MAQSSELAQIEAINKGLTTLNGTLNATATNYLTLVKTIADGNEAIKANVVNFDGLAKAQKQTTETAKQLDSLDKALIASEQKLKETEDARLQTIIKNRLATQEATKAIKDKVKAETLAETSLVRMRQKLSELTAAYDKSGTRTKEAASEINKLSREIGKAEAATNRHQRGVGGYADQLGVLGNKFSAMPGMLGNVGNSISGLGSKLATLGPIGAIIAGSILAIGAPLFTFFTKSEKGVEMLERKTAGFKAAWSILVGEMISGGEKMADALEKPEKKTQTLWTKIAMAINPAFIQLGVKMDMASNAAENYTRKLQEIEDAERALIVPRSEANRQIKEAMLLYNDESKSLDQRMSGLRQAIDLENKTSDNEMQHQQQVIDNIKEVNKEKQIAGQLRDEDDLKLQNAIAKQVDLQTESLGRQTRASARLKAGRAELLKDSEEKAKKENEITKKVETEKVKLLTDSLAKQEQLILNDGKEKNAINEKLVKDETDLMDGALKDAMSRDEKEFENWYDLEKKKREKSEEEADKEKELKKETAEKIRDLQFEIAAETINGIFDLGSAKRDEELSALDVQREKELSNKNLTEAQKAAINEEYDKKAAAIKTKQAKADKLQALFNIALSTAQASIKSLAQVPLPLGLPLLLATIALGAVQAGLVAAQPIPKFKDGTKNAPDKGIFGEAGRELMFLRSGDVAMANKATYFEGSKFKGAQILSNPETEKMISMNDSIGGRQITDERILNGLKGVERAIMNKPVAIFDKENRAIGHATSHSQTIYLNRLMRNN